jgi:hypothetical protein
LNCSPPLFIFTRSVQLHKQLSLFSPRPSLPSRPFEFTPNGARRLPTKAFDFQKLLDKENDFKFSIESSDFKLSFCHREAAND